MHEREGRIRHDRRVLPRIATNDLLYFVGGAVRVGGLQSLKMTSRLTIPVGAWQMSML